MPPASTGEVSAQQRTAMFKVSCAQRGVHVQLAVATPPGMPKTCARQIVTTTPLLEPPPTEWSCATVT